ncbi:MAG: alcohol dehydrogenase catalytic domain-containing protein [Candidatus Omnitrophica bacterium]|nr:alcohol dehydrogenase catalytic domain-containing protein [Candidatus Omnitrophota bacterium]
MKALVYEDWFVLKVKEVPKPRISDGEALIKVEACGICGSELETYKNKSPRRKPPLILGHEFSGTVIEIKGSDSGLKIGRKVVVNSVISCGKCLCCKRGALNLCTNRQVFGMNRDGAIAEYVKVPLEYVYQRPDSLDAVKASLVEPLANAVHLFQKLPQINQPKIAVIGAGCIGLMIMQAAKLIKNSKVIVCDLNEERLTEAKNLGADLIIHPGKEDFIQRSIAFSGQGGLDICIDAVGSEVTKKAAINVLRPGGHAVWIGLFDNEIKLDSYAITLYEKSIMGTYSALKEDFQEAVRLLADGRIKAGDWVKIYKLDDAVEAFHDMLEPKGNSIKAVIRP